MMMVVVVRAVLVAGALVKLILVFAITGRRLIVLLLAMPG